MVTSACRGDVECMVGAIGDDVHSCCGALNISNNLDFILFTEVCILKSFQ